VWDSIFIPAFGGVPAKRALNLCYPDGQLAKMHANPTSEFGSRSGAHIDYKALRQLNTSELLDDVVPPRGSWESLVHDLASVFSRVQPSVIVAPLPLVDPNPDHGLTTTAVCEALRRCDLNGVRLFLYVIHNQWTELYPFGPAGSGVSLPPTFDPESIECDALYSLSLSSEQQMWKCLALQAMHDLGDFTLAATPSSRAQWRSLKSSLGARLKGLSNPPTSYMRRAVRPDEVFFVLNLEQAERLARVHTQQLQEVHR
jgi:hypothetical protein